MGILEARISVLQFGADTYVIGVGGELDLHSVPPLRERLAGVLKDGARHVLVDLAGVSFIESTTLSLLLTTARELKASGGRLVLVTDDRNVKRAIEVAGLGSVLDVEASIPEAVQELVDGRKID